MDIQELKPIAESVEAGLANLVQNKQISDYRATVNMNGDFTIYYKMNYPLKFIRTTVTLPKNFD
jgi:hypothetical protein